jgi:hypothetical protein
MQRNTKTTLILAAVAAITLNNLPATGAEPPNLAAQVAQQQAPKVELPKLPADASGIYRLSLEGAMSAPPLVVLLEVKGDKVVRAVALPIHRARLPWPADAGKLVIKDGRITGEMAVQVMTEGAAHPDRFKLEPASAGTITIDVPCQGVQGTGTYSSTLQSANGAVPIQKGTVNVLREAPRPVPEICDVELQMYAGLTGHDPSPHVVARGRLIKNSLTELRLNKVSAAETPMKVTRTEMTLRDGRLTGRIEGEQGRPFTLEINGEAIGRQLYGTVTCVDGATNVTTSWVGHLHDVSAWRLPMDYTRTDWTWEYDLPADPALTNQAAQEAQIPVLPGEPGKARFWTWRSLVSGGGLLSGGKRLARTIHAPTFDLQETAGAMSYRFTLKGSPKSHDASYGCNVEFTADKPWRSLAPVWKDVKTGEYQLTVTPLDAAGNAIPGKMRLNVMDPGAKYGRDPAGWITKEMDFIPLIKRPSFQGPYFKPRAAWRDLALECSRWERDGAPIPEAPFSLAGRNHPFIWAWSGASQVWGNLAARSLTTDPAERAVAEAALAYLAGETVNHQAMHGGMINDYKSYTAVSHFLAGAAMDTVVQTGDPQWREIVLTYARALVKLQNDNGSFGSLKGKGTPPGGGWADWPAGNPEFGASELLYTLGRIRRDLKTDEFVEAEKKALGWMKNKALPERFFPTYVHHSASQGYPVSQHPISALMFARYLLELAPTEERNVKLAEELARWAEDYSIDWTRSPAGPQKGQITPYIPAADRINCDPAPSNLLAAIVFEQLGRETGDKLWFAKADALAAAVTVARDPASGYLLTSLVSNWGQYAHYLNYGNGMAGRGWATQLMREYDALTKEKQR